MSARPRGAAIIEVIVSVMILGMILTAIFGLILASHRGSSQLEPLEAATRSAQRLSEVLVNYVSADPGPRTLAFAPDGSWRLPGDACATAMEVGCEHDGTAFLDARLRQRFPGARLTYRVEQPDPDSPARVDFTVTW